MVINKPEPGNLSIIQHVNELRVRFKGKKYVFIGGVEECNEEWRLYINELWGEQNEGNIFSIYEIQNEYPEIVTYLNALKDKYKKENIAGFYNNYLLVMGDGEKEKTKISKYVVDSLSDFILFESKEQNLTRVLTCKDATNDELELAVINEDIQSLSGNNTPDVKQKIISTNEKDKLIKPIEHFLFIDIHSGLEPCLRKLQTIFSYNYKMSDRHRIGLIIATLKQGERLQNLPEAFLNIFRIFDLDKRKFLESDLSVEESIKSQSGKPEIETEQQSISSICHKWIIDNGNVLYVNDTGRYPVELSPTKLEIFKCLHNKKGKFVKEDTFKKCWKEQRPNYSERLADMISKIRNQIKSDLNGISFDNHIIIGNEQTLKESTKFKLIP